MFDGNVESATTNEDSQKAEGQRRPAHPFESSHTALSGLTLRLGHCQVGGRGEERRTGKRGGAWQRSMEWQGSQVAESDHRIKRPYTSNTCVGALLYSPAVDTGGACDGCASSTSRW